MNVSRICITHLIWNSCTH